MSTRQTNKPCPKCGSYYRNGNLCNVCNEYAPIEEVNSDSFLNKKRPAKGALWDKKRHKVKWR